MDESIDIAMEEASVHSLIPSEPLFESHSPSGELSSMVATETPISLCSSPSIGPATPSLVIDHEEQKPRTDNQGRRAGSRAVQGFNANTGSQRRQPRSNASSGVTGGTTISRVEKKAGKRRGTTNDHNNDGDDPGRKRGRPPKSNDDDSGTNRFACPFLKKNRAKHFNCLHFRLKRAKDVKQHIVRKHPFHCPACFEIFPDAQKCEEHTRLRTCQPGRWSQCDAERTSISESQKLDMASRATIGRSEADQWFSVWEILFPGFEPPASPYLGSEVEEGILMVRELLASSGLLALENLNSTVNLGDGVLNNMLASCNIRGGTVVGNTAGQAIDTMDLVLQSLSRVTAPNDDFGSPNSAFWGAELSDATTHFELSTEAELGLDVFSQDEFLCQTPRMAAVQAHNINDQIPTELNLLSHAPSRLVTGTQDQSEETTGTQIEGLIGIDAILRDPVEDDDQCSSTWEDYLVESRDMNFDDEYPHKQHTP